MFRFLGDRKIVFGTILLPGIMIYFLYNFMGDALSNQLSVEEDYKASCYVEALPQELSGMLEQGFAIEEPSGKTPEEIKKSVREKKTDLYIVFPENFMQAVSEYDAGKETEKKAPLVEIYYNSSEPSSTEAYSEATMLLDAYESQMANKFDINLGSGEAEYDLATDEDSTATYFSSMLPMLLLIFLFSGSLAVAPESIAGEKERGTIATLLVTPVRRSHIVIGKIMALSITAMLSGISSTIGTVLSLPSLMAVDNSVNTSINGSVYGVREYLLLAVVIISTVLVLVTLLSIISAYSKSIKEAQTFTMPVMILVLLVGITAMFGSGAKKEWYFYCIPCYNSVQDMIGIFQFQADPVHILLTVCSNIIFVLLGIFVVTKMFHSEKILFNK